MTDTEVAAPVEEEERGFGEARFTTRTSVKPSPDGTQRREHSRFSVDLEVSVGSDHNFYAGFLENMSAGGVFIATHLLKPVGSVIDFNIQLPDSTHVVRGKGEVRWVREYNERSNVPPGVGLRFVELSPGSLEAISDFLATREPLFWDD